MTTKEAFEKLISTRAWYKDSGIGSTAANLMAKRFRDGNLSNDKMDEVLEKAGYKVLAEKQWGGPGHIDIKFISCEFLKGTDLIFADGVCYRVNFDDVKVL